MSFHYKKSTHFFVWTIWFSSQELQWRKGLWWEKWWSKSQPLSFAVWCGRWGWLKWAKQRPTGPSNWQQLMKKVEKLEIIFVFWFVSINQQPKGQWHGWWKISKSKSTSNLFDFGICKQQQMIWPKCPCPRGKQVAMASLWNNQEGQSQTNWTKLEKFQEEKSCQPRDLFVPTF